MLEFLAVNQYIIGLTVVGFVIASLLMILIVLVQRPQGGGLSDAFGAGGGGGGTAFGAKTGDALTTGTIGIFVLFLALAIALNFMLRPASLDDAPTNVATTPVGAGDTPASNEPVQATNAEGDALDIRQIDNPFAQTGETNTPIEPAPGTEGTEGGQ